MAVGERQTQKHRRKMPSFSSSLLDSIYHSIDEPPDHRHPPPHSTPHHRNAAALDEIESLRRAIMIEKWMENYSTATSTRHLPSNSASSTDSSSCIFTASDTDSSTPRPVQKPEPALARLTRTKSKKAKEPVSPGGRIANFLNSIFSPKKEKIINHPDWSSVRKSRSMKDTTKSCLINTTTTTTTTTTSSRNNKSKRSVRFCPVSVNINILDDEHSHGHELGVIGSRYIKKNIESIRLYEKEKEKEKKEKEIRDFDDKSCASSDLFELENIGNYESELPVYATTHLRMNPPFSIRN